MELRDKMEGLRKKNFYVALFCIIIFGPSYSLLPRLFLVPGFEYVGYIVGVCVIVYFSFEALFESIRPDFIITDEMIVLSTYPAIYLIWKKGFRYIVEYNQIAGAYVSSNEISLSFKDHRKSIDIRRYALDDFEMARLLVITELEKRKIACCKSSS